MYIWKWTDTGGEKIAFTQKDKERRYYSSTGIMPKA